MLPHLAACFDVLLEPWPIPDALGAAASPAAAEDEGTAGMVSRLLAGLNAAFVTDAGMPTISDPGQRLVRAAADAGVPVSVAPGPSSPIAALAVSGLVADRWVMEGFLPRGGSGRGQRLAVIARELRAVVLLESPVRLSATLSELAQHCGDHRQAVVARELTKLHEEVARGSLRELAARFADGARGEVVIVLGPAEPVAPSDDEIRAEIASRLASSSAAPALSELASELAAALAVPKNRVYRLALVVKKSLPQT